jgi:hypothetical protein
VASASRVLGIVTAIDHRGAEWLKTVLGQSHDLRGLIILGVFAGCPTRPQDLEELLELQVRSRLQFRLLPMERGLGSPANCIAAVPTPETANAPVFLVGPSPNFGLDGADRTQVNLVFPADAVLFDEFRRWFDCTWPRSAELTASTAGIPALVPATGSPDAAASWAAYCAICAKDADCRRERHAVGIAEIDPETEEVNPPKKPDGVVDDLPTIMLDLPKLDRLAERISRIVGNGRQVTIAHWSLVRPLDAPVNPATFGQQSEYRDGSITQRQSFRVSALGDDDLREINEFRRGSQTVIEKLGLPLEKGLYWVPNAMIPIVEAEIWAIDERARQTLKGLVGKNVAGFIKSKIDKIKQDLTVVYHRLGGKNEVPEDGVTQVINDLTRRMEQAIGDRFVAPINLSEIRFTLSSEERIQAPWAQAARLSLALARFPRMVADKPRTLAGLQTPELEIIAAMNVADDVFMKTGRDRDYRSRARSGLHVLDRIAGAMMMDRDRCEASFMLMDDRPPREIDKFIAEKESVR